MAGASGLVTCALRWRERPEAQGRDAVGLHGGGGTRNLCFRNARRRVGILRKRISSDELVSQPRVVQGGETAIDPGRAARAVDTAARNAAREFWPGPPRMHSAKARSLRSSSKGCQTVPSHQLVTDPTRDRQSHGDLASRLSVTHRCRRDRPAEGIYIDVLPDRGPGISNPLPIDLRGRSRE